MRLVPSECMEGPENCVSFQHNLIKMDGNVYFLAGRYLAWSISQGGPGLPVMNPLTYNLVFNMPLPNDLDNFVNTIADEDVKLTMKKVCKFMLIEKAYTTQQVSK